MKCDHCESVSYRRSPDEDPSIMHQISCKALTTIVDKKIDVQDSWTEVREGQTVTVEECQRSDGTGFCRVKDARGGLVTWWELDGKPG